MAQRSRDEHLAWAKERAMNYWRRGDLNNAVTGMASDLSRHPELKGIAQKLSLLGIMHLMNKDSVGVRRWIEGFR